MLGETFLVLFITGLCFFVAFVFLVLSLVFWNKKPFRVAFLVCFLAIGFFPFILFTMGSEVEQEHYDRIEANLPGRYQTEGKEYFIELKSDHTWTSNCDCLSATSGRWSYGVADPPGFVNLSSNNDNITTLDLYGEIDSRSLMVSSINHEFEDLEFHRH